MNILIVDDEPLARVRLKRLLTNSQTIRLLGEASNGREALQLAKKQIPDLVFLDVDMPGMSGLEVAKELNLSAVPPAIIFTTAYPEYALDAIGLNAAGYLVKPISEQSLQKAIEQLGRLTRVQVQKQHMNKISYQLAGTLKSIEMESIFYFSAEEKYTKIVFEEGDALIEQSLKQLEALYQTFILRIHRNTLVNRSKIIALHNQSNGHHVIQLQGCDELLPVSRRELRAVKDAL
ncbi:LytTR family DNA-binding domain-containing protein [Pseudoalteromonas sp.]|uniref:LytR/AlgR family response regulator transcription factor n=1 Tax=Pseudoalteromonas sp. TaxID=53249 RepID=UPI002355C23E|nr:LytTR family DNA-binding domain-containing protein [Pseudoalteromonas sp.]